MGCFKGRVHKVIEKMEKEGRVTHLSKEDSFRIDSNIAKAFIKIKEEFRRKAAASWNYMKDKIIH